LGRGKVKFPGLILWSLLTVWLDATALDATTGVRVTPLAKETSSWDGKPIVYPAGTAEMTALLVEIAPGTQTGWHCHLVPNFAYMLEGRLELTLDDGRVKLLNAGDALSEVVNRSHNGRNVGSAPVKLVVFYAGTTGTPLSVEEKECLPEKMKMGCLDYKSVGSTCQP
jgi:quercetin dioxygenase-like cupin family protein